MSNKEDYLDTAPCYLGELTPEQVTDESDTILGNLDELDNLLMLVMSDVEKTKSRGERAVNNACIDFTRVYTVLGIASGVVKQLTAIEPVVKLYE